MSGEHTVCECKDCGTLYVSMPEHNGCPVCYVEKKRARTFGELNALRKKVHKLEKNSCVDVVATSTLNVLNEKVRKLETNCVTSDELLCERIEKLESLGRQVFARVPGPKDGCEYRVCPHCGTVYLRHRSADDPCFVCDGDTPKHPSLSADDLQDMRNMWKMKAPQKDQALRDKLQELAEAWEKRRGEAVDQGAQRESGVALGNSSFCYGYAEAVVDFIADLKKALEES